MNVIISGCTCSGKTTLANKIKEQFENATHMEEDWYYKDIENIPRGKVGYLLDSPNAFNTKEFIDDVNTLLKTNSVIVPKYDIKINKRLAKNEIITKGNINIFEGLHTIDLLRNLSDSIKVFIDIDMNECLKRRILRDEEYLPRNKIIDYFNNVILPLYKVYIEPQKKYSDVIIERNSDEECLLMKLKQYYNPAKNH